MENLEKEVVTEETPNSQADSQAQTESAYLKRYKEQLKGSAEEAKKKAEEARIAKEAKEEAEKRAERYRNSLVKSKVKEVYSNGEFRADALKSLADEDPELASEVAKNFTVDWNPAESVEDLLKAYAPTKGEAKSYSEEDLIEKAVKRLKQELAQENTVKKVGTFFDKLSEDDRQQAESYYKKIVGNRKITPEEATEYAEMATLYVQRNSTKNSKKENASIQSASIGFGGVSAQPKGENLSDDDYKSTLKEAFGGSLPHYFS